MTAILINTVKLSDHPEDITISWPSKFDPSRATIHLHRNALNQPPTGYLSAPVEVEGTRTEYTLRIVRDNNVLPEGSSYLGSYSDSYMGPAFHALHVFLLP